MCVSDILHGMKNKQKNELAVCGYAAVKALEKKHPQLITRLYFTHDRAFGLGPLCKILAANKVPYNLVESQTDLEKLCGSIHHQGVVAMIEQPEVVPLTPSQVTSWLHESETALLLDRVGNANNLGAIIRSAAFFGIKNIIIPLDEAQSSITTSSYRVAQGGMEFVSVYSVSSIPRLLQDLRGKMIRIGTDIAAKTPISEISSLCTKDGKKKPALIVLGNEEHGISSSVKELCDHLVTIPHGQYSENDLGSDSDIDSLNVAQAAAIILYECRA